MKKSRIIIVSFLALVLLFLFNAIKSEKNIDTNSNLTFENTKSTGNTTDRKIEPIKEAIETNTVLINAPQTYNDAFNQEVVCSTSYSCDIPFFELKTKINTYFSAVALDVMEVNGKTSISSTEKDNEVAIAIFGEKLYLSNNIEVGNLYTYIDNKKYQKTTLINKQPKHLIFNPYPPKEKTAKQIKVNPSERRALEKDSFSSLALSERATLELMAGNTYFVDNLKSDSTSAIHILKNKNGNNESTFASIIVYGHIEKIPKITADDEKLSIAIIVLNSNKLSASKFSGVLFCPYCALAIESNEKNIFTGQIYSRSIQFYPDSKVIHRSVDVAILLSQYGKIEEFSLEQIEPNDTTTKSQIITEQKIEFNSRDKHVDSTLNEYIRAANSYGEDSAQSYNNVLTQLKSNAKIAIPALYDTYRKTPVTPQNQKRRWDIVQAISAIGSPYALEPLTAIAKSDIAFNNDDILPNQREALIQNEYMIHFRAIDGLTNLLNAGDERAAETLYFLALNKSGTEQGVAIAGYLQTGDKNQKLNDLKLLLPSVNFDRF